MKHFGGLFAGLAVAGIVLFFAPEPVDASCKKGSTTKCKKRPGRCLTSDSGSADRCQTLFCSGGKKKCSEVGSCNSWGWSTQDDSGRVTTPSVLVASLESSLDGVATSRSRAVSVACTPPPVTRVACVLENGTLTGTCRPDLTNPRETIAAGLLARQATAR